MYLVNLGDMVVDLVRLVVDLVELGVDHPLISVGVAAQWLARERG